MRLILGLRRHDNEVVVENMNNILEVKPKGSQVHGVQ